MGNTKQRQVILAILTASDEHMTAEQIFVKARLAFPHLGKGTVYRNLNIMADEGVIKRVHIPGEPIWFDANTAPHQHMVCVRCGNILDIGDLERKDVQKLVDTDSEIVGYNLVIYAICKRCAGKM